MQELSLGREVWTGCGPGSKTRTCCILTGVKGCREVVDCSLLLAESVFSSASQNSNCLSLCMLGNMCGRLTEKSTDEAKKFAEGAIRVGQHTIPGEEVFRIAAEEELSLVRIFAENECGEVMRPPYPDKPYAESIDEMEAKIQCLKREVPVGGTYTESSDWWRHCIDMRNGFKRIFQAWEERKEVLRDQNEKWYRGEITEPEELSPIVGEGMMDVLPLAIFAKLVSLWDRTSCLPRGEVQRVAKEEADSLKHSVKRMAERMAFSKLANLSFYGEKASSIEKFLSDVLDTETYNGDLFLKGIGEGVTNTLPEACRVVLKRVFDHASSCMLYLSNANLVRSVSSSKSKDAKDDPSSLWLFSVGRSGQMSKALAGRIPKLAVASVEGFQLSWHLAPLDSKTGGVDLHKWEEELGVWFKSGIEFVLSGKKESVQKREEFVGILSALASPHSVSDPQMRSVFSSQPAGCTLRVPSAQSGIDLCTSSSICRSLIIKEVDAFTSPLSVTSTCVSLASSACLPRASIASASWCGSTSHSLKTLSLPGETEDSETTCLSLLQDSVEKTVLAIKKWAASERTSITSMRGRIGGIARIGKEKREMRCTFWRGSDSGPERLVVLLPNKLISLLFADYGLASNETSAPFLFADSVLMLKKSMKVGGKGVFAWKINKFLCMEIREEFEGIHSFLKQGKGQAGRMKSSDLWEILHIREVSHDTLTGMVVKWEKPTGYQLHMLSSSPNHILETVVS